MLMTAGARAQLLMGSQVFCLVCLIVRVSILHMWYSAEFWFWHADHLIKFG